MSINISVALPLNVVKAMQNLPIFPSNDEAKAAISLATAHAMLDAVKKLPFERERESAEDKIYIFVDGIHGHTERISVNQSATVYTLKNIIWNQYDIPYDLQTLLFNDKKLRDDKTLQECFITWDSENGDYLKENDMTVSNAQVALWQNILNNTASYKAEESVNQPTAAKMADWKVTVPINLPLNTIMAVHNGEGIGAALSELADSGLEGHAVVHDVARAIIDTVNGSAYRITSNSKSTTPPATYSHPTPRAAKEYEAYDSLSMSKGSVCSERPPSQEGIIEKGGWSSPLYIHIIIRSTINKDEHFYVMPDTTVASLFDSYMARTTVSGSFSGLELQVWGKENVYLEESATIKQLSLENDDILVALESPGEPVTVTFKDAMLRTHIIESEDNTMVKALLLSYADDTSHDFENLIFMVDGESELKEADYALTLYGCGIKNGDLITVRPREEKPKYINIFVRDVFASRLSLTIREDAQTSTLRSQYQGLTGFNTETTQFSFGGLSLMDEQQLRTVGIREGSTIVSPNITQPLRSKQSLVKVVRPDSSVLRLERYPLPSLKEVE
ncbi:hypothetical protein KC349_g8953 [Hortaea werneckii]|nr:hypothetical protein KC349_g8953 [Hortaea werneckii]